MNNNINNNNTEVKATTEEMRSIDIKATTEGITVGEKFLLELGNYEEPKKKSFNAKDYILEEIANDNYSFDEAIMFDGKVYFYHDGDVYKLGVTKVKGEMDFEKLKKAQEKIDSKEEQIRKLQEQITKLKRV
jgi:hypothetical protein